MRARLDKPTAEWLEDNYIKQGLSVYQIADILNNSPTRDYSCKPWSGAFIAQLLKNNGIVVTRPHRAGHKERQIAVTKDQYELIIGSLLGDGTLSRVSSVKGTSIDYRFVAVHSDRQFAYVNWKYDRLKNLCLSPPKLYAVNYTRKDGSRSYAAAARTVSHPAFTKLREYFYPEGRKIIPLDIKTHITPLALATWYLDDGRLHYSKLHDNGEIACEGFTKEENETLCEAVNTLYNCRLHTILRKNSGTNSRIYVPSQSTFFDIIAPYVIPSMQYKLPRDIRKSEEYLRSLPVTEGNETG